MELAEILYQYPPDVLKELARLCDCADQIRKDDWVRCIHRAVMTPASLRRLWEKLDHLSKRAVAAAYYNEGEFNPTAFAAQYGSLPERPKRNWLGWRAGQYILLDLFIYNSTSYSPYSPSQARIPSDLLPLLAELVPPADKFQLEGLAVAPKTVTNRRGKKIEPSCAETEQTGLHDLLAYLRLVQEGKLTLDSSDRLTLPSARQLIANLLHGDFFPLPEKYRANQTIRPFGLDIFAREAGLVTYSYTAKKLALTEPGQAFYQSQNVELLLEAFESWIHEGDFDELSRIPAIKGQKTQFTSLTSPATRREAIVEALSWCPVGVWIDIEDFYRAIKIWHFDFEVETTPYINLYVGYKEGDLLNGAAYWPVVKGSYINVVLWEYLGSLGALDLLYIRPEEANLKTHLQAFNEFYLSPYDGLGYFRVNNLGAYLLGQAGEYAPTRPLHPPLFTISPDLGVTLSHPAQLTPNDLSHLAQLARPRAGRPGQDYQLDTQRLLATLEAGGDLDFLTDFLRKRHQGPLPAELLAWLDQVRQNSQAFKIGGPALFIQAKSAELAELALADPVLQKFCALIDKQTLVIPAGKEKALRLRLKELEYVLLE